MIKNISIVFLLFCIGQSFAQSPRNYYFSSSTGSDSNSGTEASPFQTITKLNSLMPAAGSKILFKRGDKFIGQIIAAKSGSIGLPIVYDSYGTGNLPILTASDNDNSTPDPLSTIRIYEKQYLEFHNLQIENERFNTFSSSPDTQAYGIYIWSQKNLASGDFDDGIVPLSKYLRFSNLRFQNIYPISKNTIFNNINTSGIYFIEAFVNDVIIEDCYFTDIERVGIWLNKYVSDAIIRNNKFIDIGGSGTIMSNTKRVLYENNLMRFTGSNSDPRMTARGSGMWVFGSDDVVAQYNTSQHARGDGDSSGMHVDFGNTNVLFQYNYSEDSAGGFCETLGKNDNIIWRYNISVNEGDKSGVNKLLWVSDYAGATSNINSTNVHIYNNTIYAGNDYKNAMEDTGISMKATSLYFRNNIIYLEPAAKLGSIFYLFNITSPSFGKNIMYGGTIRSEFLSLDPTKIVTDPKFSDSGRRHFSGYKLMATSPALGTALSFTEPVFPLAGIGIFADITSNASKDIFGNPVNLATATNIGAYNGSGETTVPTVNSYEAEAGIIVAPTEAVIECVKASDAKAVNVEADGKSLTFSTVNVPDTNLYLIKVFYANPVKKNLKVTINGGATETVLLPNSDLYCYQSGNPTNFPIIRTLNSGNNSIKFEGSIIDKIELISLSLDSSSWTGDISTVWTNPGNWNPSFLPTVSTNVTIAAATNQPVIGTNVDINSLSINSTASLTVNSGFNLNVTGAVANRGSMTFQNNANLIQGGTTNTNTGNVIVKRNSSPLLRLDYTLWSSPVASQNLLAFSPATTTTRFYNFNTTYNVGGVNGAYSVIASPSTTNFATGKGYLIRMPNDANAGTPTAYPGVFTGVPNSGTISVALVDGLAAGLRYNLVGNPYPSPVKMQNFVFDNTANIQSTLYFWRKTNGTGTAYCTWTAGALVTDPGTFVTNGNAQSVNPAAIIQTGQGFFVEAKSGATAISFKNSQRVANNVGQFFRTKEVAESSKIWLNATNATGDFSQMAITYFAGATLGIDDFDGKYINDSGFALTSSINNGEYTIQGRPAFDAGDVVPLAFKTTAAGDYTIALDHFEGVFATGQDVYLLDSKTGAETDLKTGSYTFAATAGVDNARFSLKYQKTLQVDAPAFNVNSVRVYKNNGALYVNSGNLAISNIKVFDIQGRLIAEQKNLKTTSAVISNLRTSNQVLIVKIAGEDNSVVTKKVVN